MVNLWRILEDRQLSGDCVVTASLRKKDFSNKMRFHCLLFGYRRLADVPLKAIPVNFVVFVLVLGVRYESVSQCGEMVMSRLVNKRVLFHKLWAKTALKPPILQTELAVLVCFRWRI